MAAFLAGVFAQVLRIAAPCQEKACCHFDGTDCRLATRLVQLIPAVVESLPACRIRPDCRWFLQVICGQTGLALCGGKCKSVADFLSVLCLAAPIVTDGKLNPLTEH
jgi:hypothetical protein